MGKTTWNKPENLYRNAFNTIFDAEQNQGKKSPPKRGVDLAVQEYLPKYKNVKETIAALKDELGNNLPNVTIASCMFETMRDFRISLDESDMEWIKANLAERCISSWNNYCDSIGKKDLKIMGTRACGDDGAR